MHPSADFVDILSAALRRRLQEIAAADHRRRSFVVEPGDAAGGASEKVDEPRELRDLVLRALTAAADPVNYVILRRLADDDASVHQLAEAGGVPRLGASERVNDLLQVGFAARSLDGDRVGLTPAGRAMVDLIEAVTRAADQQVGAG